MGLVKKQNRSLVLRYMNSHKGVSRKEIAKATGLTPAAVTQICNDFLSEGLIKECGTAESDIGKAGRRKVMLEVNSEYAYIIGINVESDSTFVVVSNLFGDVKADFKIKTSDPNSFVEDIKKGLDEAFTVNKKIKNKIIGGCVAVPGEVDEERGVSVHAYGVWEEEVLLCAMLEKKTGFSFIIKNNVDAFAIAETVYGTAMTRDNIMVVKWGPGVGCSIIIDGRLYEGRHGRSAELGHSIVEKDGKKCSCGRCGCLETKISLKAMQKKRKFDVNDFGSVYRDFDYEIDLFARTLVNAMSILEPDRVVLFGRLFSDDGVRDSFVKCCEKYFRKFNNKRILYTPLADREEYIGPVATYIERKIF